MRLRVLDGRLSVSLFVPPSVLKRCPLLTLKLFETNVLLVEGLSASLRSLLTLELIDKKALCLERKSKDLQPTNGSLQLSIVQRITSNFNFKMLKSQT